MAKHFGFVVVIWNCAINSLNFTDIQCQTCNFISDAPEPRYFINDTYLSNHHWVIITMTTKVWNLIIKLFLDCHSPLSQLRMYSMAPVDDYIIFNVKFT